MQRLKDLLQELNIDFVAKRRVAGVISVALVVLSWVAFFVITPNWGIDFLGGTEIVLKFDDAVEISELRGALRTLGLDDDAVQQINRTEDYEFAIRIKQADFGHEALQAEVVASLEEAYGDTWIKSHSFDAQVGATLLVEYNGDDVDPREVAAKVFPGRRDVIVQAGRDEKQIIVRLPGLSQRIVDSIQGAMGEKKFKPLSIDAVGPKVGGELRRQGFISIAITLALVLLYVAFRFDVGFAPGAVLALFHDVSLTVGCFVVLQKEINLPIIGALLTIVGYSLNDTIVIYDRIRENRDRYRRQEVGPLINTSINETLSRTLATSLTTFLAIVAFLIMGGPVIEDFAFAMMLGIVFGTYSTVYVASPMILVMEDFKPFLGKLVAGAAPPESPHDPDAEPQQLTQSEQRRRERAEKAEGGA